MYIINGEKPSVFIANQEKGFIWQYLVGAIDVEIGDIQKEDIYVEITYLIYKTTSKLVLYETNVTNLPFITTGYYYLIIEEPYARYECHFIGGEKTLIMALFPRYKSEGTYYLGNISKEIKLNNISIKYNIFIQPVFNNEKFFYNNIGDYVFTASRETLDFTSKDSFYIVLWVIKPKELHNVTLNPDAPNLEYKVIDSESVTCLVPKSHFDGKSSGYYYIILNSILN